MNCCPVIHSFISVDWVSRLDQSWDYSSPDKATAFRELGLLWRGVGRKGRGENIRGIINSDWGKKCERNKEDCVCEGIPSCRQRGKALKRRSKQRVVMTGRALLVWRISWLGRGGWGPCQPRGVWVLFSLCLFKICLFIFIWLCRVLVVVHRLSSCGARALLSSSVWDCSSPTRDWTPCPLHWKADS